MRCVTKRQILLSQPVAVPSYLLAIVVGALEKREISPRCAIWAEPSIVEKALWEFEEVVNQVPIGRAEFILSFLASSLIFSTINVVIIIGLKEAGVNVDSNFTNVKWFLVWLRFLSVQTEQILSCAESICGPYVWGR